MAIIIIATDIEQQPTEDQPVQAPPLAPPSPEPAPEPAPAPTAPPEANVVPPMRTLPGKNLPGLIGEYLEAQEIDRGRLQQEIYAFGTDDERLKAIQNAYNATNDDNKRNDLINLVFSCPVQFTSKKGSRRRAIGPQLIDSYKGEEAEVLTYTAIWHAFDPKITNPYHYITYVWGHNKRHRPRTDKDVFDERDTNAMVAYRAFKPYVLFMENPDMPPGGSKTVEPDLVKKVDDWQISENAAVWEQYKRDVLRDRDGRIDKAIRWTLDTLKQINGVAKKAEQKPPVIDSMLEFKIDENTLDLALGLGLGNEPAIPDGEFNKDLIERGNYLWRSRYAAKGKNLIQITKFPNALSNPKWVQLAKVWLNETQKTPTISFDDWLIGRLRDAEAKGAKMPEGTFRPADWHPDGWIKAARTILEQYGPSVGVTPDQWKDEKTSPYFLNGAMVGIGVHGALGPKYVDMAKWKMQDERELGYMPGSLDPKVHGQAPEVPISSLEKAPREQSFDPRKRPDELEVLPGEGFGLVSPADAGAKDKKTKERNKLISPENPRFRDVIKGIVRELYSPFAMTGKSEDQMATDSVLSDIGSMMARKFVPQNAEEIRATEMKNAALAEETFRRIRPLLTEPLLLKHYPDDPGNDPQKRYELAQMEVAKDINMFLADDARMADLDKALGIALPKVAMLRNEVRRAMFLCGPQFRFASVNPRVIEYLIRSVFGNTPKGAVARFLCTNKGPISRESEEKIKRLLSKEYKHEIRMLDTFLFDIVSSARQGIADFVSKVLNEDSEAERIAGDLKITAEEVKAACQHLAK